MKISKNKNFSFERFTKEQAATFHSKRVGETRVGEIVPKNSIANSKIVLLGIEESAGPIANNGFSGSENAWTAFLANFLNTQIHKNFNGKEIMILGSIKNVKPPESTDEAKAQVEELDSFVLEILNQELSSNQIPIVIGGGHNNALPLMRWSSQTNEISCINIDPHADCRSTEFRHSGNSFSTALKEKTIRSYSVLGLHEAYNNQFILDFLEKNSCYHTFYEDYLLGKSTLLVDFQTRINEINPTEKIAVEIDMDAIAFMPSSALSPSGFSVDEIRSICLNLKTIHSKVAYLHFPEAAPKSTLEHKIVGKALSYFVRDFITFLK
jgi:formiminoglutamase